jgi:hypothetical protein
MNWGDRVKTTSCPQSLSKPILQITKFMLRNNAIIIGIAPKMLSQENLTKKLLRQNNLVRIGRYEKDILSYNNYFANTFVNGVFISTFSG